MKKHWPRLIVSATTPEALKGCMEDDCSFIRIEGSLYDELKDSIYNMEGISDYDITFLYQENMIVLEKIRSH